MATRRPEARGSEHSLLLSAATDRALVHSLFEGRKAAMSQKELAHLSLWSAGRALRLGGGRKKVGAHADVRFADAD